MLFFFKKENKALLSSSIRLMQFTAEHTNNHAEHKLLIMHLISQDERLIFFSLLTSKQINKQNTF